MKLLLLLFSILVLVFLGCSTPSETLHIVFLGNSITYHTPAPDIGWYSSWGMAASSENNDYVHQTIKGLHNIYPQSDITFEAHNIAAWERDFNAPLPEVGTPDILIIRLGENVNEAYAQGNDYLSALSKLVDSYTVNSPMVVVTGNFWASSYKDAVAEQVAKKTSAVYVSLVSLQNDPSYYAYGLFENEGVALHPSDKGMKGIATLILKELALSINESKNALDN